MNAIPFPAFVAQGGMRTSTTANHYYWLLEQRSPLFLDRTQFFLNDLPSDLGNFFLTNLLSQRVDFFHYILVTGLSNVADF
jgi:hypothetical protein